MEASFVNDDATLLRAVEQTLEARRKAGLEGLVGGLAAVVINTAAQDLLPATDELLASTALRFEAAMDDPLTGDGAPCLLLRDGLGPDFLVKSRLTGENPFAPYNSGAKTGPDTAARLETFIFTCQDVARYAAIQQSRGVVFLTPEPVSTDAFVFIQTAPSPHTGNSLGMVQWKKRPGAFVHSQSRLLPDLCPAPKPDAAWLDNVLGLDHVATRVRARQRDAAITEFMALTNYGFDFAVYVESLNSITNVARLAPGEYAQVFTSGIAPADVVPEQAGPTERFIANYGVRPHHMAFCATAIDTVVAGLGASGMHFLSELVGSREEGLKQIFSAMSPRTLLVHEYIERYDDFDGFFTKSNVTHLTRATEKQ